MADPLSIAASIAGIISLTDTVFRYTFRYTRTVSGAKDEINRLSEEINSFSAVLRSLHALACDLQAQGQEFDCALRVDHLSQCQNTFEKVKKRLKKACGDLEGSSKLKAVARQLKWPFSASETKELIADVSRHKNTISLATSADTMRQLQVLLSNQCDRFDKIDQSLERSSQKIEIGIQILLNSEKKRVLDFFMPPKLNPQRNLDQSIKWRQPTTGTWLLESQELKQWYTTPGSRLWLKGIPGGGKTVLAGAVIQEALSRVLTASNDIGVAFFFCDYKNETTHSPVSILGSIAYQIALQKDGAFELLKNYYEELHPERSLTRSPDTDELRATISRMSEQFDHVYIIFDGVDECQDEVEDVSTAVQDLADCTDNTSIAVFSREEDEIEAALDDDFRHITISARTEDIETYIRAEMMLRECNGRLIVKDAVAKDKIESELVRRANGMFRWVACQLDYMTELWTDEDRLEALNHLPVTLHDSYFRILRKINKLPVKTRDMVRLCIRFLAVFPGHLTIEQLCQAISTPTNLGANLGQIISQDSVARKCSSLIRKSADGLYFEFAHFTVQEFLSDSMLISLPEFAPYRISNAEDEPVLGLLCLKFIQLKNFESEPFDENKGDSLSFYPEAATRWPQLTANGLESQGLLDAARSLFRPTESQIYLGWLKAFISSISSRMSLEIRDTAVVRSTRLRMAEFQLSCRPLHVAAALNLPEICSYLIQEGVNANACCSLGTPLELSLSSFLGQCNLPDATVHCDASESQYSWLEMTLPCPERRNETINYLRLAGARTGPATKSLFYHSMIISWRLKDFRSVRDLLSNGLVPTEHEIDTLQAYLTPQWSQGQSGAQLGLSLEAFNDYLLSSSFLETQWGLKLGKLIWCAAVAMELPFTNDSNRTNSRIALSVEALKAQINFAIADDNHQSLSACLDDGRVRIDEVGWSNTNASDTLLHQAIRRKAVNCADLLLERGSNPYAVNSQGKDAVLLSGSLKSIELLDILVRHNVSLLGVDKDGWNIWHFAARSFEEGSRDYWDILFSVYFQDSQKGLRMRTADGLTPLDQAFEYAQPIEDKDAIMSLIYNCHQIPLFWEGQGCVFPRAFKLQSEDIIKLLLQCGLDPATSGFSTASPLHYLDCYVSLEWVSFLKSLFPHNHVSRYMGRLPIELYVDGCIKNAVVPEVEILAQLTFDGLFWNLDNEGRDPWRFLCLSDRRLGSQRVQYGWNCFQHAFTHYIHQGCLVAYEENNKECGLVPFIRMLDDMNRNYSWPPSAMRSELLVKSLALSGYWKANSRSAIRFLKATIAIRDADTVKCLLDKSVPTNDPCDNGETIIQYAFGGETALNLCSRTKGRIILMSILETQSLESLKAASTASPNGGLIYGLIHQRWQKSDARWILEYLARIGVDIDGVDESPQSARGATPLAYHLQHDSLAMSEVLLDMGASLNGKDYFLITYRPVHLCSASGNVAFLKKILEVSKRTNAPVLWEAMAQWRLKLTTGYYFDSMSGFHIACYKGDRDCVNFFLDEIDIDIQSTSRLGHTALHFAAMNGDTATIMRLTRYGFDVMAESKEKATPLHIAVTENRPAAVRTLIQLGAKSTMDNLVRTPLMIAQFQDNAEIIEILENEFGKQSDDSVDDRHTIRLLLRLKSAIDHGDLAGCQSLISKGCPLNTPLPRTGNASPLTYALVRHQTTIAEWLCQTGASVLSVNDFKVTSMDTIITAAHYPGLSKFIPTILQRFIDQGGNWDDLAFRLIAQAAASGNEAGLRTILTHLPTYTIPRIFFERRPKLPGGQEGPILNLLHFCVHRNRYAVVRLLLEKGFSVDVLDGSGATPLAYVRRPEMVDLLVEFGASPTSLLTVCLANNFHFWGQNSTRVLDTLTHAFQQQSGLSSMAWVDTRLSVYYDSTYMRPGSALPLSNFLNHYPNGSSEVVNYLAGLLSGIGLGLVLQGNTEHHEVEPFPWHLYQPTSFPKITFLKSHFHLFCRRFGHQDVKRWANLEPAQGWSPLCRAASQNCTERMENCLSLGADIEFEGCPLGSALMIASACGQLDAVKLLVRRNAKISYEGRAGRLSVFKVAASKTVRNWLLVGRFNDQRRIKHIPEHDSMTETKFWSGLVQARANLHGYELVRDNEARIDCAKRLMLYKRIMRGRVAPYINGLIFNRHQEPILSAFISDR